MAMRTFKLPADLDALVEVIPPSFQYPENEDWSIQADEAEAIGDQLNGLRRIWPIFRLLQLVVPPMRDVLRGYVWEEGGQVVGLVNVIRKGNTDQWLIGNVSVLPEHRRRGIARKLVTAAVDYAKGRGASRITLEVVDGNVPAYQLYQSLSFEHYAGQAEMTYESNGAVDNVPLPDGYVLEDRGLVEWQPGYQLAQRITPEKVRQYEPLEEGGFRQPRVLGLLAPLIFRAMGERPYPYTVRRASDGQVVASLTAFVRRRKGGVNRLSINLDPECGEIAPALVHTLVRRIEHLSPGRRIEASAKHWQAPVVDAMEAMGFRRRSTMHALGIICEDG